MLVRQDQAVRDLVAVVGGGGKRVAEHRAAALDGAHDALGGTPRANAAEHAVDDRLPGLVGAEGAVDRVVAQHDDPVLEEGDIDKDPGPPFGPPGDVAMECVEGPALGSALELVLAQTEAADRIENAGRMGHEHRCGLEAEQDEQRRRRCDPIGREQHQCGEQDRESPGRDGEVL